MLVERVCGGTAVVARSLADIKALGNEALSCNLAILDINLGPIQPTGLEAYQWLFANGFHGATIFLTGHAEDFPAVAEVRKLPGVDVLSKPVDVGTLTALIRKKT